MILGQLSNLLLIRNHPLEISYGYAMYQNLLVVLQVQFVWD